jgi:hypothetical protein
MTLTDPEVVLAVVALCTDGALLGSDEVELLSLLRGCDRRTAEALQEPLLLLSVLRESRLAENREPLRWDRVIGLLTGWPWDRCLLAIATARAIGLIHVEVLPRSEEMPS